MFLIYREHIFLFLLVVIGLCESLDLNITGCVEDCEKQLSNKELDKNNYDELYDVCEVRCSQTSIGELVKKDYKKTLPKPATPRLVKAKWKTIRLQYNTTELEKHKDLHYILEVKTHWRLQERKNVFVLFPYTKKYHIVSTNNTSYDVAELEPNTGYQFRVIAIKRNATSPYSEWSNVINTTSPPDPCVATDVQWELRTRKPYKKEEKLNSILRWNLNATSCQSSFGNTVTEIRQTVKSECKFESKVWNYEAKYYAPIRSNSSNDVETLNYDCWYTLKMAVRNREDNIIRLFHLPKCIRINDEEICKCPTIQGGSSNWVEQSVNARFTRDIFNSNHVTVFLNWNDTIWKNAGKNITYFKVTLYSVNPFTNHNTRLLTNYVDFSAHHSQYNQTFFKLTYNSKYEIAIKAYYGSHCEIEKMHLLRFTAKPPCENSNCSKSKLNSKCQPDGYDGKHKCVCDYGFFEPGNKCVDECQGKPCEKHMNCTLIAGEKERSCTCENNFTEKNGFCERVFADVCKEKPCKERMTCTPIVGTEERNCTCEQNYIDKNGTCVESRIFPATTPGPAKDASTTTGVIVVAVLAPSLIILIAVCIIIWLRKRHEKRMGFMEREMAIAFEIGSRSNPRWRTNQDVTTDDSERVINLLYVSQDYVYKRQDYITEEMCSFEIPPDSMRFMSIIGRGEFGRVYAGEAKAVNNNPEWTKVAIKTFTESADEEQLSDILREIELMKDLGKHENVIQMFGCCLSCRPICLVMEYAPDGNLKNYLRSLKKKCKDIVSAQTDEIRKCCKSQYATLIEADENLQSPPSPTLVIANTHCKLEETGIKRAEDLNIDVAARMKEEIRVALDPKELESFARQIATGMKHVSGLGIVHRDLAARNILLGENQVLKISDFGLSREGTYVKTSNGKIPLRWMAIEAIKERTYSTASDVWAFGVVLWEICTLGDTPYSSISDRDLKKFLLAGNRLEKVDSCTDDIYDIMQNCWSHLPNDRPTFTELSNKLWDLEHKDKAYVNFDSLMQQSIKNEDSEQKGDQLNQELNDSDDGCDEQLFLNGIANQEVAYNKGCGDSTEDMNANIDQEQSVSTNV